MKKFMWILLIGLGIGIPVLISDLYWMWIPFLAHSQEYPAKVSASLLAVSIFVTLLLALTAVRAIEESDKREVQHRQDGLNREKRDKKERLLNEIIEWVLQIRIGSLETPIPAPTGADLASVLATFTVVSGNDLMLFGKLFAKKEYISAVVVNNFEDELKSDIDNMIDDFTAFLYLKSREFKMTEKNIDEAFGMAESKTIISVKNELVTKEFTEVLTKYTVSFSNRVVRLLVKLGNIMTNL